jgi:broad specificity phosphatase PhoE
VSQLVFVRYGQTEANRNGVLLGRLDPPLNDAGREQAAAVAARVAPLSPVRIATSPLVRAVETAAVVARACALEVEIDKQLIEVDYGEYDGLPLADLPPDLVSKWRNDADFAPPGGESLASVGKRMGAYTSAVLDSLADGPVVAVSHVSPIKAAVSWVLHADAETAWRAHLDQASITRVAITPRGAVLRSFNETWHLS